MQLKVSLLHNFICTFSFFEPCDISDFVKYFSTEKSKVFYEGVN